MHLIVYVKYSIAMIIEHPISTLATLISLMTSGYSIWKLSFFPINVPHTYRFFSWSMHADMFQQETSFITNPSKFYTRFRWQQKVSLVSLPSCMCSFDPQESTDPSFIRTRVCFSPHATLTAPSSLRLNSWFAVFISLLKRAPSWPLELLPHT